MDKKMINEVDTEVVWRFVGILTAVAVVNSVSGSSSRGGVGANRRTAWQAVIVVA